MPTGESFLLDLVLCARLPNISAFRWHEMDGIATLKVRNQAINHETEHENSGTDDGAAYSSNGDGSIAFAHGGHGIGQQMPRL